MQKIQFRNKLFLLFTILILLLVSCEQAEDDDTSPGVFLSIMGFNEDIEHEKMVRLSGETQLDFEEFIDDLDTEDGTLLYHSVKEAFDYVNSGKYSDPEELSSISFIIFSDGLDQGSFILSDEYADSNEYLTALNTMMEGEIDGIPVSCYTVGYQGLDNPEYSNFTTVMDQLANSRGGSFLANDLDDLEDQFALMADSLDIQSHSQNLSLTIYANDSGTPIRFTFDGSADALSSTEYIEGIFTISGDTFSITNLVYNGLTSNTAETVTGTRKSSTSTQINFKFEAVTLDSGDAIPLDSIKQYWDNTGSWVHNTEFDPDENTDTESIKSSAIVMIIMDCSSSLGSDFDNLKVNMYQFINTLYREYKS